MSFGRRLALFFLLIAIVPTAALIAILLFVSSDSQHGKADARIAAGLQTALAIYSEDVHRADARAHKLARDPALASALRGHSAEVRAWARDAARQPGIARVELLDAANRTLAAAGPVGSLAFARVGLTEGGRSVGTMRLSTTTAPRYVAEVKRLTGRELVVRRGGTVLATTVEPPGEALGTNQTADLTAGGRHYRGHEASLGAESLVIMGPPKSGGALGVGRPVLAVLIWFLVAAVVLAWALARTLNRLHQRVETQAVTDPLTGLWNRRYFAETLEREVARALRFGHEVSLIIIDVDDFKKINDRQGHLQGDLVLAAVADVVREATRSIDVAARYGGDELALTLVETGREGAAKLGERLGERMRETEVPLRDGGSMQVTISVGVATVPDSADGLESLVDAADRALLRAKRAGKNQIRAAPVTKASARDQPRHRSGGDRRTRRRP